MKYFQLVEPEKLEFKKFKKITPKVFKKTLILAKKLKGKKIIHLNSTQLGGGVAELLRSQVPLENSLGLKSLWYVLKAPTSFFKITKKIHNLLQGEKGDLNNSEKKYYLDFLLKTTASEFQQILSSQKPDLLIIHDPQPLALIKALPQDLKTTKTILRIHIDLSSPNKNLLRFLSPFINSYHKFIFSHPEYQLNSLPLKKIEIITPGLNPFSEKNRPLKLSQAKEILAFLGINPEKPILSQVARFDPWKDHFATLKAYYLVKNNYPNLQLVFVGIPLPADDPQAKEVFKKIEKHAKGDPDIFLFSNPYQIRNISNDLFINAVHTASTIIMHKSIKEGFGLVITEAMWKKKPVIGGKTKGISLQIQHKKNGFLVEDAQEASIWIKKLLKDKNLRKKIGTNAHQTVKSKFLMSRFILEHLKVYQKLL